MGLKSRAKSPAVTPGFAVRAAAASLLSAVVENGTALDAALEANRAFTALDVRDRALCRAVLGTALRRHGAIEAVLGTLIEKPPRHAGSFLAVMEIAAAQILFMGVADHAAVSVAVDQVAADQDARYFKGLANAVLRRMARERDALLAGLPDDIDTPEWLSARWRKAYGDAITSGMMAMHRLEPSLDLSVKSDPQAWAERLGGIVLPTNSVRLIASGPVETLAGYDEGAWWVQDAAAALPVRLLGDVRGMRVADLCAAPGGKTAALAEAGATVTAVDVSAPRLERLSSNLNRLGLAADVVAADILVWTPAEPFDAILLDAPCSATGTIRRHPDVAWLKRPADITKLAELQFRMLARAVTFLKPGGTIVFCTCSLESEEGEAHIARTVAELPLTLVPVETAEVGGLAEIVRADGTVRTLTVHLPHSEPRLSGLDGFFMMRLRKNA